MPVSKTQYSDTERWSLVQLYRFSFYPKPSRRPPNRRTTRIFEVPDIYKHQVMPEKRPITNMVKPTLSNIAPIATALLATAAAPKVNI